MASIWNASQQPLLIWLDFSRRPTPNFLILASKGGSVSGSSGAIWTYNSFFTHLLFVEITAMVVAEYPMTVVVSPNLIWLSGTSPSLSDCEALDTVATFCWNYLQWQEGGRGVLSPPWPVLAPSVRGGSVANAPARRSEELTRADLAPQQHASPLLLLRHGESLRSPSTIICLDRSTVYCHQAPLPSNLLFRFFTVTLNPGAMMLKSV